MSLCLDKATLRAASTHNLLRLARWLGIRYVSQVKGTMELDHQKLVDLVWTHINLLPQKGSRTAGYRTSKASEGVG